MSSNMIEKQQSHRSTFLKNYYQNEYTTQSNDVRELHVYEIQ